MYNNSMNNNEDDFGIDWNPYDWLLQLEDRMKELQHKHNVIIQNQKEMALAYNTQLRNVKNLQKKVDTLESILWRSDNEQAINDYFARIGRPKR